MTVVAVHPAPATRASSRGPTPGPTLGRLIRAELLKARTTNLWWILAICAFATIALALVVNLGIAEYQIHEAATHRTSKQSPRARAADS